MIVDIAKKASEMNNEEFMIVVKRINELEDEKSRLAGFGKQEMADKVQGRIDEIFAVLDVDKKGLINLVKKMAKEELSQEEYNDIENYDKKLVEICKIADTAKQDVERWKIDETLREKDIIDITDKIANLKEEMLIVDAMIVKSLDDFRDVDELRRARQSIEDSIETAKKVLVSYGCYS